MYMKFFVIFLIENGMVFIRCQAGCMVELMWDENAETKMKIR